MYDLEELAINIDNEISSLEKLIEEFILKVEVALANIEDALSTNDTLSILNEATNIKKLSSTLKLKEFETLANDLIYNAKKDQKINSIRLFQNLSIEIEELNKMVTYQLA